MRPLVKQVRRGPAGRAWPAIGAGLVLGAALGLVFLGLLGCAPSRGGDTGPADRIAAGGGMLPAGPILTMGDLHACVLRVDGELLCWHGLTRELLVDVAYGNYDEEELEQVAGMLVDVPPGLFRAVSAAGTHTVAIRADGSLVQWGFGYHGRVALPEGPFLRLDADPYGGCAQREDGSIACWPDNCHHREVPALGRTPWAELLADKQVFALGADGLLFGGTLPKGVAHERTWLDIAQGGAVVGVDADGRVYAAWATDTSTGMFGPEPDEDAYARALVTERDGYVRVGFGGTSYLVCALRGGDGTMDCFDIGSPGDAFEGPTGAFDQVAVGFETACGLAVDGEELWVACAGRNPSGLEQVPLALGGAR